MKKIIHISTVHARYDNRILRKQCVSLHKFGYDVTLLVSDKLGSETYEGVSIIDIGVKHSFILRIIVSYIKLLYFLLKNKYDIIQFHDPELLPLAFILRLKYKNIIYDIHEDYRTSIAQKKYLNKYLKSISINIYKALERLAGRYFTLLLAEKYYVEFAPNGICILNYPILEDGVNLENKHTVKGNKIKLIYTGNVTEDRGAFLHSKIPTYVKNCQVELVGKCDANLASELMENCEHNENLKITGINRFVNPSEIMDRYKAEFWTAGLAIFPLTVHYEKKELTKFFEYMLHGIPIICSNFPYWEEFVTNNKCGIAVDPLNEEEINNAIMKLFEDSELRRSFIDHGRKRVLEELNWQKESEKLKSLYSSFFSDV